MECKPEPAEVPRSLPGPRVSWTAPRKRGTSVLREAEVRTKVTLSSSGVRPRHRWHPGAQRLDLPCHSPAKLEVPFVSVSVVVAC